MKRGLAFLLAASACVHHPPTGQPVNPTPHFYTGKTYGSEAAFKQVYDAGEYVNTHAKECVKPKK